MNIHDHEKNVIEEAAENIHGTFAAAYAIGEKVSNQWLENVIRTALRSHAALVEAGTIERCARVCETMMVKIPHGGADHPTCCAKSQTLENAAAAIRALQDKKEQV